MIDYNIKIYNMHGSKFNPSNEYDVRIDRETWLGNPAPIKVVDDESRDKAIDWYKKYFYDRLLVDHTFKSRMNKLISIYAKHSKLNLYCWCAPKRCHGEVIREYIIKTLYGV